ncbi:MAG: GGDEF domain-containing phosphodiesterase, partial [Steroidobacteraceae bacterium]
MSQSIEDSLIRALPELCMIVRDDGSVQTHMGGRSLGIAELEQVGETFTLAELFGQETTREIRQLMRRVLKTREPITYLLLHENHERELQITPHGVGRVFVVVRNVSADSERRGASRGQSAEAVHELLGRDAILELAHQAIADARLLDRRIGVVLVNLRRLPAIERAIGRAHSERLLEAAVFRVHRATRGSQSDRVQTPRVGRYAADTLLALVDAIPDRDAAGAVVDRLRAALAEPVTLNGREYELDPALGVVLVPGDGLELEELLGRAEVAMAEAIGRNASIEFFSDTVQLKSIARLDVHEEIGWAIERDQFELYYQPRIELASGRIVALEALLRWRHPTRGMLAPASFIEFVEATGHAERIGEWVLGKVCRDLNVLEARGLGALRISVNVSRRHFSSPLLAQHVRAAAAAANVALGRLELELTERMVSSDAAGLAAAVALRPAGMRLIIDDFGTAPISLRQLAELGLSAVKLDRSIVQGIDGTPDTQALCTAAVAVARSLQLTIIAEGVESPSQRDFLARQG